MRKSAGILVLACAGAALLGIRLVRAGLTEWTPLALPLCVLVAAFWSARRIPCAEWFPFRAVPVRLVVPAGLSLLGTTLVTFATVDALVRSFPPSSPQIEIWYGSVGGGIVALLAGGVASPVAEELWFRGVVLRGALARHPERRALVISAVLFGIAHLDPYRIVSHSLVGWVFGRWMVLTASLVPSVLGHMALNLAILIPFHRAPPDPSAIEALAWTPGTALLDSCGVAGGVALVVIGLRWMRRLVGGAQRPLGKTHP